MRVLHCAKGILHMALAPISEDDLVIGPGVVVGKEDGLAQDLASQTFEGSMIKLVLKSSFAAFFTDLGCDQGLHMLPL